MDEFYQELINQEKDDNILDFCRRKVIHGMPFVFSGDDDGYYFFRKRISDKYDVPFHEVYIVGSAKLGFSPHKKTEFSLDSDIDVAIVSTKLFDEIMDKIRFYQMELRKSRRTITETELKMYHNFLEYTAMGWIRPDKLPLSFQVGEMKRDWFDFFRSISYGKSEIGDYKVAAGVFKSYYHLEMYLVSGMKELRISKLLKDKYNE